jgi:hypothetical protein
MPQASTGPATATREWVASLARPRLHRRHASRPQPCVVASDQSGSEAVSTRDAHPHAPDPATFIAGLRRALDAGAHKYREAAAGGRYPWGGGGPDLTVCRHV